MAIITFWNNAKKQTGQTMSIAAIASIMAIEHNYKILLISTQYNDDTLECCFGEQEKNRKLLNKLVVNANTAMDNGIEGLSRVANSGKITPEVIQNYTHVVYRNRLEILYGYKNLENKSFEEEYLKTKDSYREIIQNANKYYDIVLVDLNQGMNDDVVKPILNISDVIVYTIEQKMNMINDFLKQKEEIDCKKKNNIILNIGRFDECSKYSVKNISRYSGLKKDITVIPYNTLFFEASGEEGVADLFLKIRNVSETDKNATFVKQIKNTVENIIYKLQEVQMKI